MCALRLCVYDDDDDDESYELTATQQLYYALIALVHATKTRIVVNISITTLCEQIDSVGFIVISFKSSECFAFEDISSHRIFVFFFLSLSQFYTHIVLKNNRIVI